MIEREPFLKSLAETISWCSPRVDLSAPRTCLRSPELIFPMQENVVQAIVGARHHHLGFPKTAPASSLAGGRLVIFEPHETLSCGLGAGETDGFIDVENCPPWDTWVGYIHESEDVHYLVSWVPPLFVEKVDRATQVVMAEELRWLDSRPTELGRLLKAAGLEPQDVDLSKRLV